MATRRKNEKKRKARLYVYLNPKAKEEIEQAALMSHQTLNDFVMTNLLQDSAEVLKHQRVIHFTNGDRALFLTALEADARPNRALRKAAKRFKRSYA